MASSQQASKTGLFSIQMDPDVKMMLMLDQRMAANDFLHRGQQKARDRAQQARDEERKKAAEDKESQFQRELEQRQDAVHAIYKWIRAFSATKTCFQLMERNNGNVTFARLTNNNNNEFRLVRNTCRQTGCYHVQRFNTVSSPDKSMQEMYNGETDLLMDRAVPLNDLLQVQTSLKERTVYDLLGTQCLPFGSTLQ